MSAALDTTERGPKTTKAPKAKKSGKAPPWPTNLAEWKARNAAKVAAQYADALEAVGGFPALTAHVAAWLPLAQVEGDLSAVHSDMEERGAPAADEQHAEELWADARDITRAARLRLLNSPASDPDEILAKVAAFVILSEKPVPELKDEEGCENELVAGLLKDLAAQAEAKRATQANRSAWETARSAYHAAEAYEVPEGASEEAYAKACDDAADAHAALLMTPAPDLRAVAEKLSFYGEYTHLNAFLDEASAREMAQRGDWLHRCVAAAYLDLLRIAGAPPPTAACATDPFSSALVAALEAEDAAIAAYVGEDLCGGPEARALQERRDDIISALAGVQATTLRGAALQLTAAFSVAELVRGVGDDRARDEYHTELELLLKSAARVLAEHIPGPLWPAYIGGEHPGPDPVTTASLFQCPDDVTLIALDRELEGLFPQINAINVEMSEKMDAAHARALEFAPHDDPRHHELRAQFEEECGAVEASQRNDALLSRLGEIERAMRGLRATTLQGLRAKARVAAWWRDYDPDHDEVDSLLRDLAAMVKVPPNHLPEGEFNIRDLFEEYERLGGKITALEQPGGPAGRPWIGVRLAPTSTRSQELEALMTPDVLPTLHMLAVDAFGKQSWASAEDAMRLAVPQEVFE